MFNKRRIRSQVELFKSKYLNVRYLAGVIVIILLVFAILIAGIYYTVYEGYRQKFITDPAAIPEEIDTTVLISDGTEDNIAFLIDQVEQLYLVRKFTALHIFILDKGDDTVTKELISGQITLVTPEHYTINLRTLSLEEVCTTTLDEYKTERFVIVSFEEYAWRTNFLCNNLGGFSVTYIPHPISSELEVPHDALPTKIKEVIGKIFNIQI